MTAAVGSPFLYGPKVYHDYLSTHPSMPDGVGVKTHMPASRPNLLVLISTAPAPSTDKPRFFAWRRLVFQCWGPDELSAAALCDQIRQLVVGSIYAHLGVRQVRVIGEPARFDDPSNAGPGESVWRFQTTIDVLFRAKF
jgi:hypothetical protein